MSDKRTFVLVADSSKRYKCSTPMSAGKLVAKELFNTSMNKKKIKFAIRETTKHSKKKTYKYCAVKVFDGKKGHKIRVFADKAKAKKYRGGTSEEEFIVNMNLIIKDIKDINMFYSRDLMNKNNTIFHDNSKRFMLEKNPFSIYKNEIFYQDTNNLLILDNKNIIIKIMIYILILKNIVSLYTFNDNNSYIKNEYPIYIFKNNNNTAPEMSIKYEFKLRKYNNDEPFTIVVEKVNIFQYKYTEKNDYFELPKLSDEQRNNENNFEKLLKNDINIFLEPFENKVFEENNYNFTEKMKKLYIQQFRPELCNSYYKMNQERDTYSKNYAWEKNMDYKCNQSLLKTLWKRAFQSYLDYITTYYDSIKGKYINNKDFLNAQKRFDTLMSDKVA